MPPPPVICQNPDRVKEILESINDPATAFFGKDTKSFSEEFIEEMKLIQKAIHPTEVFDMIAGTSVGALMAFALVGGNCPIPQALRRMKELRKRSKLGSGLSIAPPRQVMDAEPNGLWFWLNYFPQRTTDGMASYCEFKKQHLRGTNQRIFPRSKEAKQFKTDDKRVDEMIKCMEKERDDDPTYLQEIGKRALLRQ